MLPEVLLPPKRPPELPVEEPKLLMTDLESRMLKARRVVGLKGALVLFGQMPQTQAKRR